jgi:hypothetical protein
MKILGNSINFDYDVTNDIVVNLGYIVSNLTDGNFGKFYKFLLWCKCYCC